MPIISFYCDDETLMMINDLMKKTGLNRSQTVRALLELSARKKQVAKDAELLELMT